jgi:hypothetical protein
MTGITKVIKAAVLAGIIVVATEANAGWASVAAWFMTMQREVSAVAIQVKQNAVAANQVGDAEMNTRKQLAVAMGALMTSERVRDVVQNYDPLLGQPMLLKCDAQFDRKVQVEVFNQASKNTLAMVSSFAAASVPSRAAADKDVLTQHRELFCSVSEAKQGLCELKPNGMQAWDASYSGPFGEQTMTPDVELAAYNYITNVVDSRVPDGINCKSEACSSARLQNMRDKAIGSMVAESFLGQVNFRRSIVLE